MSGNWNLVSRLFSFMVGRVFHKHKLLRGLLYRLVTHNGRVPFRYKWEKQRNKRLCAPGLSNSLCWAPLETYDTV